MAFAFTPKRLFIPHKTQPQVKQPEYGDDMRAIENFNPINKLVAGSGVTLDPADGSGPQVEISASGGGGTSPGFIKLQAGIEGTNIPFAVYLGPMNVLSGDQFMEAPLFSTTGGSAYDYTMSWYVPSVLFGGGSISFLPLVTAPAFTGGPIGVAIQMNAADSTFTNYLFVSMSTTVSFTTGQFYQFQTTDFDPPSAIGGADLTFVNGTGESGNGIVSGGAANYWVGVNFQIVLPAGTDITPV